MSDWFLLPKAPSSTPLDVQVIEIEACHNPACMFFKTNHIHEPIFDKDGDIMGWHKHPRAIPAGMPSWKMNLLPKNHMKGMLK